MGRGGSVKERKREGRRGRGMGGGGGSVKERKREGRRGRGMVGVGGGGGGAL